MTTSFPTGLDALPDPSGSDTLGGSTPSHSGHHKNLNDAVEALEAKVGVNGSAVASSLDKKVADLIATAGQVELGYAESTSDFTTTSTTGVDITGVTTTVTVGTRPILVEFGGVVYAATDNDWPSVVLLEDGVNIGQVTTTSETTTGFNSVAGHRRRTPAAGSHTYKLQLLNLLAARTVHAYGSSGQATYVHVLQI